MKGLIAPKTYVDVISPVIFLAGPIGSAPNWHDKAIDYILSQNDLVVASPKWEVGNSKYMLKGNSDFPRARAWERYYLDIASKSGAVLFWLPGEEKHNCEKVYGAMSRFEIAQLITSYKYDKSIKFCIGTDGDFPEFHTIKYDLELDAPREVFETLEETCDEAIRMILPKSL